MRKTISKESMQPTLLNIMPVKGKMFCEETVRDIVALP